jgi:hypothetical protein
MRSAASLHTHPCFEASLHRRSCSLAVAAEPGAADALAATDEPMAEPEPEPAAGSTDKGPVDPNFAEVRVQYNPLPR